MMEYCEVTGKAKFMTKGDAQRALKNMKTRKGAKGAVYQCPDCHHWHITHHEYRKSKAIRTVLKKKINGELTELVR